MRIHLLLHSHWGCCSACTKGCVFCHPQHNKGIPGRVQSKVKILWVQGAALPPLLSYFNGREMSAELHLFFFKSLTFHRLQTRSTLGSFFITGTRKLESFFIPPTNYSHIFWNIHVFSMLNHQWRDLQSRIEFSCAWKGRSFETPNIKRSLQISFALCHAEFVCVENLSRFGMCLSLKGLCFKGCSSGCFMCWALQSPELCCLAGKCQLMLNLQEGKAESGFSKLSRKLDAQGWFL